MTRLKLKSTLLLPGGHVTHFCSRPCQCAACQMLRVVLQFLNKAKLPSEKGKKQSTHVPQTRTQSKGL